MTFALHVTKTIQQVAWHKNHLASIHIEQEVRGFKEVLKTEVEWVPIHTESKSKEYCGLL